MSQSRSSLRRIKLAAAAALTAGALVLAPAMAGTAQADNPPLYLWTTWHLYDYQFQTTPLFSQSDPITTDAAALAKQYALCTGTCFYVTPKLPGWNAGTTVFFAKTAWKGLPDTDAEGAAVASALEVPAGASLLNSYYNYGGVGTYTKGNVVYSALILTHYFVLTPINPIVKQAQ